MSTQYELLEQQGYTRQEIIALKNRRTGIAIFQGTWILAFVCLVIVQLSIRGTYPVWPPEGVQAPNALLPSFATLALLASVWLVRGALRAVRADQIGEFLNGWRFALALGAAFVLVMIYQFINLPAAPEAVQYTNVSRLLIGYHGVHAIAIGAYMLNVYRGGQHRLYGSRNFWAVEAAAKLWYFVAVAWLLFYFVLYWI